MRSFHPNQKELWSAILKTHPILRLRNNNSYYIRALLRDLRSEGMLSRVELYDSSAGSFELTSEACRPVWGGAELLPYLKHGIFEQLDPSAPEGGLQGWHVYWLRASEEALFAPDILNALALLGERIRDCEAPLRILVNIDSAPPESLRLWTSEVEFSIPRDKKLEEYVSEVVQSMQVQGEWKAGQIKGAVQGLEAGAIFEVLREAVSEFEADTEHHHTLLDVVQLRRDLRLRQSSGLEVLRTRVEKEDIGGLKYLIRYLEYQARILENIDAARRAKVDLPAGILLVGLPGCGKSMAAMAAASIMNLPLLRLEVGSLMGRYLGESEKNLREAIRSAEAAAPCILWVDELEKALGGMAGSSDDGGTGKRMLAQLLTWMQAQEQGVYIIATANAVDQLPPELLRRGRFDETFRVDLPNQSERKEILKVHLRKRGLVGSLSESQLESAARELTKGCNGADIEALVKEAWQRRWLHQEANVRLEDLQAVRNGGFTPLSEQWGDKISHMQEQLKAQGFRNASEEEGSPLLPILPKQDNENTTLPDSLDHLLNSGLQMLLHVGTKPGWTIKLFQQDKKRIAWLARGHLQDVANSAVEKRAELKRDKQRLRFFFAKSEGGFEHGSLFPNLT